VHGDLLSVSRAAPGGHLGETKTERSVGVVLLIKPVLRLLEMYRAECGNPTEGYMFTRRNGNVIDVSDFARVHIAEHARRVIGDRWRGLYAGRRAVGTTLFALTGDSRATFGTLRNSKATSDLHYTEVSIEPARAGQRVLESAFEIEHAKLLNA
jgi:hypothetical protein